MKHVNFDSSIFYPTDELHLWDLLNEAFSSSGTNRICVCLIVPADDKGVEIPEGCIEFFRKINVNDWDLDLSILLDNVSRTVEAPCSHSFREIKSKLDELTIVNYYSMSDFLDTQEDGSCGVEEENLDSYLFYFLDKLSLEYNITNLVHMKAYTEPIYNAAYNLSRSKKIQIASVEYPFNVADRKSLERHWSVHLHSSSELPKWEAYDHIEHFLAYGWNDFEKYQCDAAKKLAEVLDSLDISEIHDVGCGSGRILNGIIDYFDERKNKKEYFAYDPSKKQYENTCGRLGDKVLPKIANISQVSPTKTKDALVMFLGNTLAHIGSHKFRDWLRDEDMKQPEYIMVDFALQWKELLDQAEPEVVCGPVRFFPREKTGLDGDVCAHITTAGGPGWVKRGIVLQFCDDLKQNNKNENTFSETTHRLFTRQYADVPETYFNVLRSAGYAKRREGGYTSGWGQHQYYLFQKIARSSIEWPSIPKLDFTEANEIWYQFLVKLWQEVKESSFVDSGFFPLAILPFSNDVYARYIPRNDDDLKKHDDLFKATMWVVDPRNKKLKHAGAAKSEDVLPYAPSIYKAMLADAPIGTLEHFDQTVDELRVDSNSRDLELWHLERAWMKGEMTEESCGVYGALPIYIKGLPAFLFLVSPKHYESLSDSHAFRSRLETDLNQIGTVLTPYLEKDHLKNLVKGFYDTVDGDKKRLLSLIDLVLGNKKNPRKWVSWLETLPGASIHTSEIGKNRFKDLKNDYERIVEEMCTNNNEKSDEPRIGQQFIIHEQNGPLFANEGSVQYTEKGSFINYDTKELSHNIDSLIENLNTRTHNYSNENATIKKVLTEAKTAVENSDEPKLIKVLKKGGKSLYGLASKVGTTVLTAYLKEKCGLE